MKEYGTDLEHDLNKAKKKVTSIENKIRKRYKFLTEETGVYLSGRIPTHNEIDLMLLRIKRIEQDYVEQTRQLDAFDVTGYDEDGRPLNKNGEIIK